MSDAVIKADLKELYQAGKQLFPQSAQLVSDTTVALGGARDVWAGQVGAAGNPTPLVDAIAINEEVYALMRRAALTLADAGVTMIAVADDFAETDGRAADAARDLHKLVDQQPYQPTLPPPLPRAGS